MRDFEVIIDILKKEAHINNNEELAKMLGIGYSNLRRRKAENNTPFKHLFLFCHDRGINIHDVVMPDGKIQVHKKTDIERILDTTSLEAEVSFLKRKLTASQTNGKKAIKKAMFDMEFLIRDIDEDQKHKQFLDRGTVQYEGHRV